MRYLLALLILLSALPAWAQWEQLAVPLPTSSTPIQALAEVDGVLYVGTSRGLFRSPDDGATWETLTSGLPSQPSVRAIAAVPGFIVISTSSAVYRSVNGTQWTTVGTGLGTDAGRVAHLLYVPGDGLYAGGGGNVTASPGVYRSTDLAATFEARNNGIPGAGPTDTYRGVDGLAAVGPNVLAAVNANFGEVSGTFRSVNQGANWAHVTPGLGGADVLTTSGNTFVGGFGLEIHRSVDNGDSWIEGARFSGFVTSVHGRGQEVWASVNLAAPQRSLDGGVAWTEAGEGLGTTSSTRVGLVYVGTEYVFGGTSGANLWRRPVGGATAAEPGATAPGLELLVAPNPARGAATVTLTLNAAQPATVTVYDALGRRVAALHDGMLAAGPHAFRLDTAALPAGVYVARAVTGGAVVMHRLTVVR